MNPLIDHSGFACPERAEGGWLLGFVYVMRLAENRRSPWI